MGLANLVGHIALGPLKGLSWNWYPGFPHTIKGPPFGLQFLNMTGLPFGIGICGYLGWNNANRGQRGPKLGRCVCPNMSQGDVGAFVQKNMESPPGDRPRRCNNLRAIGSAR